ncbi:MAG: hypothetical protein ACC628_23045 [Pirellulaceae bacterium]
MLHRIGMAALLLMALGNPQAKAERNSPTAHELSANRYQSIQEAIDANPGKMIHVPAGDYTIAEAIHIRADHAGLYGSGRIVQTNPNAPIIAIEGASGVRLSGISLARERDAMDTTAEAVLAIRSNDLDFDHLQIRDNRTRSGALVVRSCVGVRICGCLVENYMRIAIDDRTSSTDWGYAFNCIDGSGIVVTDSQSTLIQGNRVIEKRLLPTPEIQKRFQLGRIIKRSRHKGTIISEETWKSDSVKNWHQGSAIVVTAPDSSDSVQILGNYVENAAQGIDIHADHVIISHNIVNNAFVGMKAMHGSRHVLVLGNQFIKNDLWSIGLMPGALSHAARSDGDGGGPAEANVDGGSIIANNIISDFGYGHAHWIWGNNGSPIKLDTGQKPTNPPLSDVVIQGNIVYDTGRDEAGAGGDSKGARPRYRYAISVASDVVGLHCSNNILHPGSKGISNVRLKP